MRHRRHVADAIVTYAAKCGHLFVLPSTRADASVPTALCSDLLVAKTQRSNVPHLTQQQQQPPATEIERVSSKKKKKKKLEASEAEKNNPG